MEHQTAEVSEVDTQRHSTENMSALSRRDKVEAGLLSKVLLDYGRLAWIRSQECGLVSSELVSYVDTSTSGENRLLVVALHDMAVERG